MDDLSAASLQDVQNFFRTYYAPNNAVLVVAGDIDLVQAKALVRKHFAAIPRHAPPPPLRDMTLPPTIGREQREVVQDRNAPSPAVFLGFRVPAAKDPRGEVVNVLSEMLSGQSGHLYESLVRGQSLATGVFAFNPEFLQGADVLIVRAQGKPNTNADSLETATERELTNAVNAFTQADLDRAKAQMRYSFVDGLQRTGGFGGTADLLAQGFTYYRDPNWVNTRLAAIDAVTLPQVQALARERLVPTNRVTLVYVPARAAAQPTTSTPGQP
jgi:predicted Zn-dependent peptidase